MRANGWRTTFQKRRHKLLFSCRTSEKTWRQKCFLKNDFFNLFTFLLSLTLFNHVHHNLYKKSTFDSEKYQTLAWRRGVAFTFYSLICLVSFSRARKESGGRSFSQCRKLRWKRVKVSTVILEEFGFFCFLFRTKKPNQTIINIRFKVKSAVSVLTAPLSLRQSFKPSLTSLTPSETSHRVLRFLNSLTAIKYFVTLILPLRFNSLRLLSEWIYRITDRTDVIRS